MTHFLINFRTLFLDVKHPVLPHAFKYKLILKRTRFKVWYRGALISWSP